MPPMAKHIRPSRPRRLPSPGFADHAMRISQVSFWGLALATRTPRAQRCSRPLAVLGLALNVPNTVPGPLSFLAPADLGLRRSRLLPNIYTYAYIA